MSEEKNTQRPWETSRKPNVQFVGKKLINTPEGQKTIQVPDAEVPTEVRDVREVIELPPASIQKRGFYHPKAGFLRRNYGSLYKKPVRLDGSDRTAAKETNVDAPPVAPLTSPADNTNTEVTENNVE